MKKKASLITDICNMQAFDALNIVQKNIKFYCYLFGRKYTSNIDNKLNFSVNYNIVNFDKCYFFYTLAKTTNSQ